MMQNRVHGKPSSMQFILLAIGRACHTLLLINHNTRQGFTSPTEEKQNKNKITSTRCIYTKYISTSNDRSNTFLAQYRSAKATIASDTENHWLALLILLMNALCETKSAVCTRPPTHLPESPRHIVPARNNSKQKTYVA